MSRSGYGDGYDCEWNVINLYRANVDRSIRGKRGQAFLRELLTALDSLPEKKLISRSFSNEEGVCALGSVARMRGVTDKLPRTDLCDDYDDYDIGDKTAKVLGIASCMAREIMFENDDGCAVEETEEHRWYRVHRWAEMNLL